MANEMGTIKVRLDGFTGAPGLMQFRFQGATPGLFDNTDATTAIAAVRAFLLTSQAAFGSTVVASVDADVEVTDWTTGDLLHISTGIGVSVVGGTASGSVLAVEGPLVQWRTSTVVGKRMLRGRSFLIPSGVGALAANGQVAGALITTVQGACTTLIAVSGVTLSVWHRPPKTGPGNDGTLGAVVSGTVPTTVSELRSRRD